MPIRCASLNDLNTLVKSTKTLQMRVSVGNTPTASSDSLEALLPEGQSVELINTHDVHVRAKPGGIEAHDND